MAKAPRIESFFGCFRQLSYICFLYATASKNKKQNPFGVTADGGTRGRGVVAYQSPTS